MWTTICFRPGLRMRTTTDSCKPLPRNTGSSFPNPATASAIRSILERFAKPGQVLLGSDSHTPNAGAMGMIAIGVGGLDVALAMAGEPYYLKMPQVVFVNLKGKLPPWVASKDIMLELLRRLSVRGGVGKIFEFGGPGVKSLSIPERATISNLGAELGATTAIFPSDARTLGFLKAQGRKKDWIPLEPDKDAEYDQVVEVDVSGLEPLIAQPSSPDRVCPVREVVGKEVRQVCIGSCNNSSYFDLMSVAKIVKGKKIHPDVSLTITPGSKQVFEMIARDGALADLIGAGARILESACGPCIGMGQAPSLSRHFRPDDESELSGPERNAGRSGLSGQSLCGRRLRPEGIHRRSQEIGSESHLLSPCLRDSSSMTASFSLPLQGRKKW